MSSYNLKEGEERTSRRLVQGGPDSYFSFSVCVLLSSCVWVPNFPFTKQHPADSQKNETVFEEHEDGEHDAHNHPHVDGLHVARLGARLSAEDGRREILTEEGEAVTGRNT